MAPSSLKKMSGVQERKEGNYASSEKKPWGSFTDNDLGLTLLPGSQIQRKDEKKSGTATKSSSKNPGSSYAKRLEQRIAFETEIQAACPTQEIAFPNEAQSLGSSTDSVSKSTTPSHVTARVNRERPFSQRNNVEDDSGVIPHDAKSAVAAPYDEQKSSGSKVGITSRCRNDDSFPRAVKQRKFEGRSSIERLDLNVSKAKEAVLETHYNRCDVRHDQGLSEINDIHSGNGNESFATIRDLLGGTRGPSKPVSYRQIIPSPDIDPARSHQMTTLVSEHPASHDNFPASNAFASKPPAKHQHWEPEKLTVHHQPPNLSTGSTQHLKHSRLLPDYPADIKSQVSKRRKGVNRSWTSLFPAKTRFSCRANRPASSLPSSVTPSQDQRPQHLTSTSQTSIHLHAYTNCLSTPSLPASSKYPILSKAFDCPLHLRALENILNTTHPGTHCVSARKRSASMPHLCSPRAITNMDFSSKFGPASIPTPPREQPSSPASLTYSSLLSHHDNVPRLQNLVGPSQDHADSCLNYKKSSSQDWQIDSNFQRQHTISLSDGQNPALTFSSLPHQGPTQPMSGLSSSNDGVMAGGVSYDNRQHLDVKPFYSYDEVKSLISCMAKQACTLEAENTSLQSVNRAMRKGAESLQNEKANLIHQIQGYERTVAQKDRQIEAMQRSGQSLLQQYKQVWGNYHGLTAALQKKDGTSKPSVIAEKIRGNHASNTVETASQTNANASPAYSANGAQLPIPRHGGGQTPKVFQGHAQAVSASLINAKSSQTGSIPAYSGPNVVNDASRASVHPRFAGVNRHGATFSYDQRTRRVQSSQPLGANVGAMTTDHENINRPMRQIPTERITIDLTDDSQPPSSSNSPGTSIHATPQTSVSGGHSPCNLQSAQHLPAQHPAGDSVPSQDPLGSSARDQVSQSQITLTHDSQGPDLEAMQIQKEAFARMAKKPLSWLRGPNPFREGAENIELPNSRPFSPRNAEEDVGFLDAPEACSVAPMPENAANGRSKKSKAVLTAEAKKERARIYRKTAADKKRREKEAAKQLLQGELMSTNGMRAHNQDRRATKKKVRQEQARKPSGAVDPREPQTTLDGRFDQGGTGVQKAGHGGSIEQATSDDHDSLFGDDEDYQMEVEGSVASPRADSAICEDDAAAGEDVDIAYVAEVEALFAADEDADTNTNVEQNAAQGSDDGFHDFSSNSEESEEE